MKAHTLVVCLSFIAIGILGCSKNEDSNGIVGKWQLIEEFEGYVNGGDFQWSPVPEEGQIILIFSGRGDYQQIRPGNAICEGTYLLQAGEIITIDTECQSEPYHQEFSIEGEFLLLTYTGREGYTIQKYIRLE
jgi:hypothetical protein